MAILRRLIRWLSAVHAGISLSVLASIGMLLVSGFMLLDLRHDAWDRAEQTSKNLLQTIQHDIARNIEIIDLSLRGVIDNLKVPGVAEASAELRQLILFDRASTARDMGTMLVLDESGNTTIDSTTMPARRANYADRDYFQAHKARADLGLYISRPLVSRLTGIPMIVLSRRINMTDGSFAGVVLGTLKLSYFKGLLDHLGLGTDSAINLYLRDGTRIMRHPYNEADIGVNIAGTRNFERFVQEGSGSFTGTSVREGILRHYTFTGVGDLPLVLNVALSVDEIEAGWRPKALAISLIVLTLCGLTTGLTLLFSRELRRRTAIQAELARLSQTDTLTGLANRRQFEMTSARAWMSALRSGNALSLLVVDADHFKRYNDRYGHAVGDEVLKGLAHRLSASVHRPNDLVCRVGGEEFVLLLPDTDQEGALRVAERVHAEVSSLAVGSAGIEAGSVTVSVGLASAAPNARWTMTVMDLYQRADAALYEAKAGGRNQTCCAEPDAATTLKKLAFHLVKAS